MSNNLLATIPEHDEIRRVVTSMVGNKSPDPYGMSLMFYKELWGIIRMNIVTTIQGFFKGETIN